MRARFAPPNRAAAPINEPRPRFADPRDLVAASLVSIDLAAPSRFFPLQLRISHRSRAKPA
jgi:hypothetical protein